MKHPKKPTLKQKKIMVAAGLEPKKYLVERELSDTLVVFEKKTKKLHNIRF